MTIKERIAAEVERYETIGHPALLQRFILRNGTVYRAAPFFGERGTPRECFANATRLATGTYVEGLATRRDLPLLIHHAWRVTDEGEVIDPTWDRPEECEYMGLAFSNRKVWHWIERTGVYGLLDTGRGLNTDLLFRRDPGLRTIAEKAMKGRAIG